MARKHKVEVRLNDEQREALEQLLLTSRPSNAIAKRMRILLLSDADGTLPRHRR